MELDSLIEGRPKRREDVGAWYARLLEAADCAGISVRELAARLGCSLETVYAWRRRLSGREAHGGKGRSTGLIRVRVAESSPSDARARLEIRTPSGHSVLVPSHFDPDALATVVAVLSRC
jgi:hypothetical protein